MEQNYSNIECKALGVLHSLENFHHYCFGHVVHIITDNRPLLLLMCKDVSNTSPRLQRLLLRIHSFMLLYTTDLARRCILWTVYLKQTINWIETLKSQVSKMTMNEISLETNANLVSIYRFEMQLGMKRLCKSCFDSYWQDCPQLEVTPLKTSIPSGTMEMNFQL